jgi:hypothetical protein
MLVRKAVMKDMGEGLAGCAARVATESALDCRGGLAVGGRARRAGWGYSTANSFLRVFIWALRRATMDECIWETRDSDRSNVAPISFIVISS